MKTNCLRQCKITMRSFLRWVRARFSNQVRFFATVRLRLLAQCSIRELDGWSFSQLQRIFRVYLIGLSVLSCEIICAIRLPWKKSCKIAVSIGRSLVLRVSHRNNTSRVEVGKVWLPEEASLSPARRLRR